MVAAFFTAHEPITMSIWGKILGGAAGFALRGPIRALIGAAPGHALEPLRSGHRGPDEADPYNILGGDRSAGDDEIKAAWRKLTREPHPDRVMAQGLPQKFLDMATAKMATINAAYDRIAKERGLK